MPSLETANGAVIYRGPSRLDGSPVVVVATGLNPPGGRASVNGKTGEMFQTWILRADIHPVESVHSGADESICGSCPLRPLLAIAADAVRDAGTPKAARCYVNKGHGPGAVYRALLAGSYADASPAAVRRLALLRGLPIRFGAYGDPGAVPTRVWRDLDSPRHTGYSHQWRTRPSLRSLVMASADSLDDAREAWAKGWRTFRVVKNLEDMQPNEILCPASAEAGKRTSCDKCGLCDGARPNDRRKSIVIPDHGPTAPRLPRKSLTLAS